MKKISIYYVFLSFFLFKKKKKINFIYNGNILRMYQYICVPNLYNSGTVCVNSKYSLIVFLRFSLTLHFNKERKEKLTTHTFIFKPSLASFQWIIVCFCVYWLSFLLSKHKWGKLVAVKKFGFKILINLCVLKSPELINAIFKVMYAFKCVCAYVNEQDMSEDV